MLNPKDLYDNVLNSADIKIEIEKLAGEHANSFKDLSDLEGVIIRGHILVERSVIFAIQTAAYQKAAFKIDRFTFSQKLIIAKMYGITEFLNTEITALNKLRNQIAHTLQIDKKYVNTIITPVSKKDKGYAYNINDEVNSIKRAISFICGITSSEGYYSKLTSTLLNLSFLEKINNQNHK